MFKIPLVRQPRLGCTISYSLSSFRLNCCGVERSHNPAAPPSLFSQFVCRHSYIYIYKNAGRLFSASCLERPFSPRLGCLFSVIAIFVPLVVPSAPRAPLFSLELYRPLHAPCPWTNIQVAVTVSLKGGVRVEGGSIRWR